MTEFMLKESADQIIRTIPRRRVGMASDVAGTAIFLSSPASAYITGAIIPLDGGYSTTR